MKLMLIVLSIFSASLSAQAAASPGAYDKLRRSFEAANTPVKSSDVHAWITKIKACASSSKESPNEIGTAAPLATVSYTSPGFGPDFPSRTYTGLALNTTSGNISSVGESFFASYREVQAPNELQVTTKSFFTDTDCWDDSDGDSHCSNFTNSTAVNVVIRLSASYLHYKAGEEYAYCWK